MKTKKLAIKMSRFVIGVLIIIVSILISVAVSSHVPIGTILVFQ